MPGESWQSRRARVAALSRHRPADDPQLEAERRDFAAAQLAEHIRRVVSTFPPLTSEQRDRIASLLRPTGGTTG